MQPRELRAHVVVVVVKDGLVGRGTTAGAAAGFELLLPIKRMVVIVSLSQGLYEVNLALGSHKATADTQQRNGRKH